MTFLKSLVSMGMSPSLQNDSGQNAAHFAAKGTRGKTNGKEVFTFLSSHGVALDDPDQNGITPLMIYVQGKSESDGLLFLAQNTQNLHQQDHNGLSAMHHALADGNPKDVSGLIASGWSMNDAPYKSETLICALSESFNGSDYEVFEEMVQIHRIKMTTRRKGHLNETATTEVTGAGTNPGRSASAGNEIEGSSPIF